MASNGIPVRLVRTDGQLIPLLVTNLAMDVDRKFRTRAIVGSGGRRHATDLNLANSIIQLEGFITDDEVPLFESGNKAEGSVDFSVNSNGQVNGFYKEDNLKKIARGGRDPADDSTVQDMTTSKSFLSVKNTSNDRNYRLYFGLASSSDADFGTFTGNANQLESDDGNHHYLKVLEGANLAVATIQSIEDIATAFHDWAETNLNVTAEILTGVSGTANSAVRLRRTTTGVSGNSTILFRASPVSVSRPVTKKFSGGLDSDESISMSAGDKVAHLFAILNNSRDGNTGQRRRQRKRNRGQSLDIKRKATENRRGDYITGIQIPFNSFVNATASEKYSAVNFYVKNGLGRGNRGFVDDKHPRNALDASTPFQEDRGKFGAGYTGIKGGIDRATFSQVGGEPLYNFTIIFVVADRIF